MATEYRHEYKYVINSMQQKELMLRAAGIMQADSHADSTGTYHIRSLYFDDPFDSCLQENIDGTDDRSKFRIRYYGDELSVIRLEKKSKRHGMTKKDSCNLSVEEAQLLAQGKVADLLTGFTTEQNKLMLLSEMNRRLLQPKVIVDYVRTPFIYAPGNVRVTFDEAIASSNQTELFLQGDYELRPVQQAGESIMEVKWDEMLPDFIQTTLQTDELLWSTFSKYYMTRKYGL